MKKIVFAFIALLLMAGVADAVNMNDLVVYVSEYTPAEGDISALVNQTEFVSTSTIIPGKHRIIGFDIFPQDTSKNAELYCGLYDASTNARATASYVFGELEAVSATDSYASKILPRPKYISSGLGIVQGKNTVVFVYAERYSS